jgi:hypothetical protein
MPNDDTYVNSMTTGGGETSIAYHLINRLSTSSEKDCLMIHQRRRNNFVVKAEIATPDKTGLAMT